MQPAVYTNTKKNNTMPDLTNFVTTKEAAEELGFHVKRIPTMVKNQTLEGDTVWSVLACLSKVGPKLHNKN